MATDESRHGVRDRRGHYVPHGRIEIAPFYRRPFDLRAVLRWLPGYFLPWNLLFALSAILYWHWLLPPLEEMRVFEAGWTLRLWLTNALAVLVFYGAFELRLYVRRAQGTRYKFNPAFPSDRKGRTFLLGRQDRDNIVRTFASGVTVWTLFECIALWAWANGHAPWLSFAENPLWLGFLALLVPVIHEFHFYCIHRLIHTPFLYRHVHSVHHKAINPSPWSSLAMHPVEHALYFSTVFHHLLLPSNPVLALYQLHVAGFGAIPGHMGFERVEVAGGSIDSHAYAHYLHHRYFEVNYGDGLVPLDRLFGTWHDGTPEGEAAMRARLKARAGMREAP